MSLKLWLGNGGIAADKLCFLQQLISNLSSLVQLELQTAVLTAARLET